MRNTAYPEKKERKRRYKVKAKLVTPYTNRAYGGSRSTSSLILNFGTR
jgi:hypothetical protein